MFIEITAMRPATKGKVYLIGAGPGDVELLTLKAARALGVSRSTLYRKVERYRLEDLVRPSAGKESDSPNPGI